MSAKIDARGLSCPEPVILVKKAIPEMRKGTSLEVVVDTVTARENVSRLAEHSGLGVTVEEGRGGFILKLSKAE
jgi:tRNA 2-thiouridine synthesizing protein A